MKYRIIPLILAKYVGEKGMMTYFTDYGKPIVRPFVMWLIQGSEKNILVDTAIEANDFKNLDRSFGALEVEQMMSFEEALESVDLSPDKIDIVIQTHLHADHCFYTRKCVNAKVYVQKDELAYARDPVIFASMYRKDLIEGINFHLVQGDHEVLKGINLLYVPGHCAGSQAVCIETEKGKAVISGFCSILENFYPKNGHVFGMAGSDPVILPGILLDSVKAFNSINRIKRVADIILPLHEPTLLDVKSIP